MKLRFGVVAVFFLSLIPGFGLPREEPGSDPVGEIVLVRHAETTGTGSERPLSRTGRERAETLADRLSGLEIERILSTDTVRTRSTAEPLAQRLGLEVEIYDHERLEELAAALRRDGGRVLVVGHSNTTPDLVELLGGEAGSPIAEDEHDRLYRVELPGGRTIVERLESPGSKREDGAVTPASPDTIVHASRPRESRRIRA